MTTRVLNKSAIKLRILKYRRVINAKIILGIVSFLFIFFFILNFIPSKASWLQSQDGRRISDLKKIHNGLELFFDVCKKYPEKLGSLIKPNSDLNCVGGPVSIGIKYLPTDPATNQQYYYELISTGTDFKICAKYESKSPEGPSCLTSAPYVINK
ncbi:MAG: hypothetical protein Q8L47_02435 [bacterium]|nr:hypothetical protein [bacterium]